MSKRAGSYFMLVIFCLLTNLGKKRIYDLFMSL
jgi:hypothetical protein